MQTSKAWYVDNSVDNVDNKQPVRFKVDTGGSVTALPSSMMRLSNQTSSTNKTLHGDSNYVLQVAGKADVSLGFRDRSIVETVCFMHGLVSPLVGKPATAGLELLSFVEETSGEMNYMEKFPKVFK